jgi:drug/metabolite transporter (DMT)-like permease
VVVVFGLVAAILYGSADFLGGAASRRVRALSVLTVSAPAGGLIILAAALAFGGPARVAGLGWALAGGAVGGAGLIVFYTGLAAGPMSVVAPVSALVSTVLPVSVALVTGERPGLTVYLGALACLAAIVLVSMEGGTSRRPLARPAAAQSGAAQSGAARGAAARGAGYGVASGLAFGLFFLFLRYAGATGVLWPAAASRLSGMIIMIGAAVWMGAPPAWRGTSRRVLAAAIASGLLDAGANAFYILATRAGMLGMAVVLTSLYPGVTVLLARVLLGERMRAVQRAGLCLAAIGVVLVTA